LPVAKQAQNSFTYPQTTSLTKKGNYEEQDKPNPINYYGFTKLEGEKQAIHHRQNRAILPTSVLYGWHPWKQNFATGTSNQLKQNKEVTVVEERYNTLR
jgi:dTDP-4-dehydrorhamnose reductase